MSCENQTDHIQRITHLEAIQTIHATAIEDLSKMSSEFTQMKWCAFGAIGLYLLQQIGFLEFIKKVFLQ
jgi:hypothetical protein